MLIPTLRIYARLFGLYIYQMNALINNSTLIYLFIVLTRKFAHEIIWHVYVFANYAIWKSLDALFYNTIQNMRWLRQREGESITWNGL